MHEQIAIENDQDLGQEDASRRTATWTGNPRAYVPVISVKMISGSQE